MQNSKEKDLEDSKRQEAKSNLDLLRSILKKKLDLVNVELATIPMYIKAMDNEKKDLLISLSFLLKDQITRIISAEVKLNPIIPKVSYNCSSNININSEESIFSKEEISKIKKILNSLALYINSFNYRAYGYESFEDLTLNKKNRVTSSKLIALVEIDKLINNTYALFNVHF